MSTHILLINYGFPPYPGIGGRRWAKFAKHLSRKNYVIHVIAAVNPFNETSLYSKDIAANENIKVYTLAPLYPQVLNTIPNGLFQKLAYIFWNKLLAILSKGTAYDKALFWENSMLKKASALLVDFPITNVIVSGAPFRINYYATGLKLAFPRINLINDFRDPWTWGSGYGYPALPKSKMDFEKQMERSVIETSDKIIVPIDAMSNHLKMTYPFAEKKIVKIPHAFDKDEISVKGKTTSAKIRVLFFGTLYDNLEEETIVLSKAFLAFKDNIELSIYSNTEKYKSNFKDVGNTVKYNKPLSEKELFKELNKYEYVLIIFNKSIKDYISTKFYEIIYTRTPIILLADEGAASRFITENNLGLHCTTSTVFELFKQLSTGNLNFNYNFEYDVSAYSFEQVTKQVEDLFV